MDIKAVKRKDDKGNLSNDLSIVPSPRDIIFDDNMTLQDKISDLINGTATKNHTHTQYVEKIEGKGLSTNDLTNELLNKINNAGTGGDQYDDSAIKALISTKVDKTEGKDLSSNDFTNDYKTTLDTLGEDIIPGNELITITHNMNAYPDVKIIGSQWGAGLGGAGEGPAGGTESYLLGCKICYVDRNIIRLYIPSKYFIESPSIQKMTDTEYMLTKAGSVVSIYVELEK